MGNLERANEMYNEDIQKRRLIKSGENKDRLAMAMKKKFNTTFIGAIDSFERAFGYLWKHGTPWDELTPNEQRFRELWQDTRNEILNKGNAQLRAAMQEFGEYDVTWNRKNYELRFDND